MEDWRKEIVERDRYRAMTTISYLANKLYPELPYARDREAMLLEIPEMRRLQELLKAQ